MGMEGLIWVLTALLGMEGPNLTIQALLLLQSNGCLSPCPCLNMDSQDVLLQSGIVEERNPYLFKELCTFVFFFFFRTCLFCTIIKTIPYCLFLDVEGSWGIYSNYSAMILVSKLEKM